MSEKGPEHRQALGLLLVANVFWGLSFPLMKGLMLIETRLWPGGSGPLEVAMTLEPRFVLCAAIVSVLVLGTRRPRLRRSEAAQGSWVGAFAIGGMILQNDGLRFTAASTSAFLTQFYAIAIPVAVALRRRRLPGWPVAIACALVLGGVAILGRFDFRQFRLGRGEIETLFASLLFMGQILALDHPRFRGNRALPVTWMMFLVEGAFFGVVGSAMAHSRDGWRAALHSPPWLVLTAVLTVGCTLLTYFIMNRWQPKITATEAGLMYCFEPIFGSILALCVPGWIALWSGARYANERVTLNLVAGGGLIVAANLLIQWKPAAGVAEGSRVDS